MNNTAIKIERTIRRIFSGYSKAREWYECAMVQKYGEDILQIFNKITKKHNVNYTLTLGTLLGAYREHGFIKHDDDIDVNMFDKDVTVEFVKDLMDNGFHLLYVVVANDYSGFHLAFKIKDVKFDIYSMHLNGDSVIMCTPSAIDGGYSKSKELGKYKITHTKIPFYGIKSVPFGKINVEIFDKAEFSLGIFYGEDFMTPKKNMHESPKNDNIVREPLDKCFGILYHFVTFEELKQKHLI